MKRKINRVGQNTLTISLPKEWTKKNNVKQGDELELVEIKEGSLLLTNAHFEKDKKEITLSIDGFDYFTLSRYFAVLYRTGYDRIVIIHKNKQIYHDRRKCDVSVDSAIERLISRNIGSEIVLQTSDRTEIECFITDRGLSINMIEKRIYFLFKQLCQFILDMAKEKNDLIVEEANMHHDTISKFINYYFRELELSDKSINEKQISYGLYLFVDKLVDKLRHIAEKINMYGLSSLTFKYLEDVFSFVDDQFTCLHKGAYTRSLIEKRYELMRNYNNNKFSKDDLQVVMELTLFLDSMTYFAELIVVKLLEKKN